MSVEDIGSGQRHLAPRGATPERGTGRRRNRDDRPVRALLPASPPPSTSAPRPCPVRSPTNRRRTWTPGRHRPSRRRRARRPSGLGRPPPPPASSRSTAHVWPGSTRSPDGGSGSGGPKGGDVVLYDPASSRSHCEVVFRDGEYWLVDESSANGTFVNGERARHVALTPGDRIRIGRDRVPLRAGPAPAPSTLDVRFHAPDGAAAPPAPGGRRSR